ncbi:radial spoke head protein 9 homolog [Octopus sinensis]|uniref:Radial spoke head protein 9 homolog n=1 Tax=Octopus sinensis TaxID=2607531 RepID=A0A6P7U8W9_9MOLL|nr:radial spoke head protein 9 homolog [Octopus sinensis]
MDSQTVLVDVEYLGTSGISLPPQIRAALQTSLPILKANNNFNKVEFWGKVEGLNADYYIAQGFRNDLMRNKTVFYRSNPSYEYEVIDKVVGEDGDNEKVEEDRLRSLIKLVDDVAIVPRRAYLATPDKTIVKNRSFEGKNEKSFFSGLTVPEAAQLSNYFYFSDPKEFNVEAVAQRGDYENSWILQFERGSALVTIRSLLWPGYVFYNIPGTCKFGSLYWGLGQKNLDLPFML